MMQAIINRFSFVTSRSSKGAGRCVHHEPVLPIAKQEHFVYGQIMIAGIGEDAAVSRIAAAIGEPARTRMLYSLLDGHARTSTELAMVAEVTPSTASVHLNRLKEENLVRLLVQGRHRYYSLSGPRVARALEGLSVLAGGAHRHFVPAAPSRLRTARSCYDHMAGAVAVILHDRFMALRWIKSDRRVGNNAYAMTSDGAKAFAALGIDIDGARATRRRFAYGCLDWSERRPHVGGALGAAFLHIALKRRWVDQDLDSRALTVTDAGRREMRARIGVEL
jgi:DNA-binding transcriptional ArsR family regulator